ncbi:SDR family NAD(P)-dependent oxidoreductase [Hydrocarboniphaga sp.]|uniref:SDR family NAD(P)-dependent oxidoreductase n=1 Tax=Hydrocarboniphaga sp. TaxID=2033016 RepID=UPI003D0DD49C
MKTLLITGAARGIGHELVLRAVARGDTVFAMVRKQADEARFKPSPNLHVVLMDVSDTASVERGFAEVDRLLAGRVLDAVINPAAIAPSGAIELTAVAEFEQTLNTNALGSLRVIKAGIPRLRGHDGRLILITSLWGKASGPMLGAYCASKHAIESLVDVARRETMGMNLHVVVVEPGVVRTDMLTGQTGEVEALLAQMDAPQKGLYGNFYRRYCKLVSGASTSGISAAQCAAGIEQAVFARKPRTRYRVGTDSKIVCFLAWLLPDRWMDGMFAMSVNHKPIK